MRIISNTAYCPLTAGLTLCKMVANRGRRSGDTGCWGDCEDASHYFSSGNIFSMNEIFEFTPFFNLMVCWSAFYLLDKSLFISSS